MKKNGPDCAPVQPDPQSHASECPVAVARLERTDGQNHRDAAAIVDIFFVDSHEVSFFELNRDENVRRGGYSEDEMRGGHDRSRPEDEQPPDIKRMPNMAVKSGCAKPG